MKILTALWMGLLVGAFGTAAMADSQKVVDIQNVQKVIVQTHAGWRGKENWLTRLSASELHRMMGLQKAPVGDLSFEEVGVQSFSAAGSVDWRNKDGVNWLGPVMNQGNCGSCVAFGAVATLEGQVSISYGIPWLRPTFSPQQLFGCGGGSCDGGWQPGSAAEFLQSTGIVDNACMPYTSGSTGDDVECSQKCADSDSRTLKIAGYSQPSSGWNSNASKVKAALKKGPLETTLTVYADFMSYSSGVYKHVTGDQLGGHAISMVGYDDTKRAWLIRNSWGAEWGENGYAWVSYDDRSGVGSETWGFEVTPPGSTVAVTAPVDREYVTGVYTLVAKNKGAGSLQFVIKGAGQPMMVACSTATDLGCSAQIDTTGMKEGRYEISAVGQNAQSQVREFYVINSVPQMSLSFRPIEGLDLTKPVVDRPEFYIDAISSPVPIQHVEFRAMDMSGKIISIKGNDDVLAHMKMGWRSTTVPNGQYRILFHGQTVYNGKVYAVDSNSYTITVKN